MLRQAQEVMDKGLMTPAEMEAHLVAHLTVMCNNRAVDRLLHMRVSMRWAMPSPVQTCLTGFTC